MSSRRIAHALAPIVGLVAFFGTWEIFVRAKHVKHFTLPAPSQVVSVIFSDLSGYARSSAVTLEEMASGIALAFAIGAVVAALMAHSRFFERAVLPITVLIQVTPIIAIANALVIWLKFGLRPKVVIVALVCVVPFIVNLAAGFRSIAPEALDLFRMHGASRWTIMRKLRIPNAMPALFTSLKVCIGLSLIGAVIAEWFGYATEGLGYQLNVALARSYVNQSWAPVFILAFIGGILVLVTTALERRVLHWHDTQQVAP